MQVVQDKCIVHTDECFKKQENNEQQKPKSLIHFPVYSPAYRLSIIKYANKSTEV